MSLHFSTLLDIIFPPTADERAIKPHTPDSFAALQQVLAIKGIYALAPFRNHEVRAAIHLTKFHRHEYAVCLLGALLRTYLSRLPRRDFLLLPIPLSTKRYRTRGYNQVSLVAHEAVHGLPHIHIHENILQRTIHTQPQTSLSKVNRRNNLAGAFTVSHADAVTGSHIILLDDVTTTGTTLHEAKKVLKVYRPASITCVALAH